MTMQHITMKEMLTYYNKLPLSNGDCDYLRGTNVKDWITSLASIQGISITEATELSTLLIEEYKQHLGERLVYVIINHPTDSSSSTKHVWESDWVDFCKGKQCLSTGSADIPPVFKVL